LGKKSLKEGDSGGRFKLAGEKGRGGENAPLTKKNKPGGLLSPKKNKKKKKKKQKKKTKKKSELKKKGERG